MAKMKVSCIVLLMLLGVQTVGQGRTYTYTVTKDCGVDLDNPATRGGENTKINVLSHALWLIGVELPPGLTNASQVQSATLTVNWDCIQQPRYTRIHQFNHPWSDDVAKGSCWNYWLENYTWGGNDPRQSAGVLDEDRLQGTIGQTGGNLNDGLIGAVSVYNVKQAVVNWLNGATNYGFGIWGVWNALYNDEVFEPNTQTWERRFGLSAESAFPPVFTLEYTPSRPDYSSAIGVWLFDEGSGTLAHDLSGNNQNGTLSSGICWTSDYPMDMEGSDYSGNHAVTFDSSASHRVIVPNSSAMNLQTELTIQFWYKDGCGASTDSEYSYIAGKKDAWFIERYRADATSDLRIRLYLKRADFTGVWYQYDMIRDFNLPQDSQWHHIAFTYSQSNGTLNAYLDGVLKTTANYNCTLATSTSDLYIGMLEQSPGRRHNCSIDEFAIFNTARSAAQIKESYLSTLYSTTQQPSFAPYGSEITGETAVTINAAEGTTIYYTTDGNTPTTNSTSSASPATVTVDNNKTLKAIAVANGKSSWVTAQTYHYPVAAAPTFSPGGKYISGPTKITISSTTAGASIYYTTNGNPPATSGTAHTSPVTITVTDGMMVQAIADANGYNVSNVSSMTFEVPDAYQSPVRIPYGSATIDGNLSEWSGATWTTLGIVSAIGTSEADVLADVPSAYYTARWQANKIYMAVKVQDKSHCFTDSYIAWNVRDAIEVFVHTDNVGDSDYSLYNTLAQQYEIGFKKNASNLWTYVGPNGVCDLSSLTTVTQAAGQVTSDGWLYYEIAITPYTYFGRLETGNMLTSRVSNLTAGQVIGLDVDVICNNSSGTYLGKKSENDLQPKYNNWENIGKHVLARMSGDANGDGAVDVGDLGILAANYGGSGKTWEQGDFNDDGVVDVGDLGILAANYGSSNFSTDYANAFGTTVSNDSNDAVEKTSDSVCSGLGLPLVIGLVVMGLMLMKLEE